MTARRPRVPASAFVDPASMQAWQLRRVQGWAAVLVPLALLPVAAATIRVADLKTDPASPWRDLVDNGFSVRPETSRRGDILDRRGRVIATTVTAWRLFVDPLEIDRGEKTDLRTIAMDIVSRIGGDPIEIDRRIAERRMEALETRYVVVVDDLSPPQLEAIRERPLRGVGVEPYERRVQHDDGMTASITGRVGRDQSGLSGIEYRFDGRLAAEPGSLRLVRDNDRRPLWLHPDGVKPGRDGEDLRLSIDLAVQEAAISRLERAVEDHRAGGGRIVVLDVRTGEILALHDVVKDRDGRPDRVPVEINEVDPDLRRSRCVTDPYEPGSTAKAFMWAYATWKGAATPDEVLPTPAHTGWRTPYGRLVRDSHYYEDSDWATVLVKSQNTGMAMVAERLTDRDMQDMLDRFGLTEPTRAGLSGESRGQIERPEKWTRYTRTSLSFGHELSVNCLQMVRAYAAFARDGTLPNLRITADPRSAQDHGMEVVRRALPPEIAAEVRQVLHRVCIPDPVTRTPNPAQPKRYHAFGKSGTAQLWNPDEGRYHDHRYTSSFIAGAPLDDPRIVVLCVIDDPDRAAGPHTGRYTAGPVVADLIDATLTYLGVPPDHEPGEGVGRLASSAVSPAEEVAAPEAD